MTRRLRTQQGTGARALEFAVLTAAGERLRGTTWSEIDVPAALWMRFGRPA